MAKGAYIGAKLLPDGYTRLEYIQSGGAQYINTGVNPNNNTRVVCDFQLLNSGVGQSVFGAWGFDSNYAVVDAYLLQVQQENYFTNWHGDGLAADFSNSISVTARHLCDKNGNIGKLDSYTATAPASTFSSPYPLYIFGGNLMNSLNQGTAMRLWSTKIYDNGTLVRDYIPCINASGAVGLYDVVNAKFYANAGSGAFSAGPTVENAPVARKTKSIYIGVDGVARKVKKAYIGDANGKAKLWLAAPLVITYSGNMTDQVVTMSGKQYRLLTLTNSGTLTVSDSVTAEVWMCGGGTSGGYSYRHPSLTTEGYAGGGGAGAFAATGTVTLNGNMAAIVGAGGSPTSSGSFWGTGTSTSFAGLATSAGFSANSATYGQISGINGGTGGGMGQTASPGTGDGVSKYPFGDSSYFRCHCAGGGAGAKNYRGTTLSVGGAGGTNGGDGGRPTTSDNSGAVPGGAGGVYGGGSGGTASYTHSTNHAVTDGENAFFYGSGGGGSSISFYTTTNDRNYKLSNAGAGYQGIIYIRIPVDQ